MPITGSPSDMLYGIGDDPITRRVMGGNALAAQNAGVMGGGGAPPPDMPMPVAEASSQPQGGGEPMSFLDALKDLKGLPNKERSAAASSFSLEGLTKEQLQHMKEAFDNGWAKQATQYKPAGHGPLEMIKERFWSHFAPGDYANEMTRRRSLDPAYPEYWHMQNFGLEINKQLDAISAAEANRQQGMESANREEGLRNAAMAPSYYYKQQGSPQQEAAANPTWNMSPANPSFVRQPATGFPMPEPVSSTAAPQGSSWLNALGPSDAASAWGTSPYQIPMNTMTNLSPQARAGVEGGAPFGQVGPLDARIRQLQYGLERTSPEKPEFQKASDELATSRLMLDQYLHGNKDIISNEVFNKDAGLRQSAMTALREMQQHQGTANEKALATLQPLIPFMAPEDVGEATNALSAMGSGQKVDPNSTGFKAYRNAVAARDMTGQFQDQLKNLMEMKKAGYSGPVVDSMLEDMRRNFESNVVLKRAFGGKWENALGIAGQANTGPMPAATPTPSNAPLSNWLEDYTRSRPNPPRMIPYTPGSAPLPGQWIFGKPPGEGA